MLWCAAQLYSVDSQPIGLHGCNLVTNTTTSGLQNNICISQSAVENDCCGLMGLEFTSKIGYNHLKPFLEGEKKNLHLMKGHLNKCSAWGWNYFLLWGCVAEKRVSPVNISIFWAHSPAVSQDNVNKKKLFFIKPKSTMNYFKKHKLNVLDHCTTLMSLQISSTCSSWH